MLDLVQQPACTYENTVRMQIMYNFVMVHHLLITILYGQLPLGLQNPHSLHLATNQQCHQSIGLVLPISSPTYEPPYQAVMRGPTVNYFYNCSCHNCSVSFNAL